MLSLAMHMIQLSVKSSFTFDFIIYFSGCKLAVILLILVYLSKPLTHLSKIFAEVKSSGFSLKSSNCQKDVSNICNSLWVLEVVFVVFGFFVCVCVGGCGFFFSFCNSVIY